jgi:hypothetical protein
MSNLCEKRSTSDERVRAALLQEDCGRPGVWRGGQLTLALAGHQCLVPPQDPPGRGSR